MLPTLTDFLAFKEIFLDYRAEEEGWGLDLHNGLVVTSLCKSSSAGFPEQSVVLCPTSRQWDCSGEQQPDILREASANDRRIHRGKTSSVLQLFINVKYWWVTKTTWLFLGPSYPEDPCVSAATSPRGFESQAPLEQAHILHSPWAPSTAYGVSATTITSPLCSRRLCMSIVHSAFYMHSSFSSQWSFWLEKCLCGCSWSQVPALRFLELLLSQLVLAGNQLSRDVLDLNATCENQFLVLYLQSLYPVFCWS